MNDAQVLDLCRESQALLEGHFLLSSGRHSNQYFQCARLLQEPARAEKLARALAQKITAEVDVVVGPAMGAVVWAHEMARALGVRALFTERADGAFTLRRGFELAPGERVLVVEDVLTTGGSAREVLALLRELGARPVAVGAIVNRSGGNPFEADELPLFTLAAVQAQSWTPADCPLCASGKGGVPVKPGSRPGAGVSAQ